MRAALVSAATGGVAPKELISSTAEYLASEATSEPQLPRLNLYLKFAAEPEGEAPMPQLLKVKVDSGAFTEAKLAELEAALKAALMSAASAGVAPEELVSYTAEYMTAEAKGVPQAPRLCLYLA